MNANLSRSIQRKADDSYLPSNQLPLLRGMLGRRLINIQKYVFGSPDAWINEYHAVPENSAFFRMADGVTVFDMEDSLSVCFGWLDYAPVFDEYSIKVTSKSPTLEKTRYGKNWHYTLSDRQYVDEKLLNLIGRRIQKIRLLIRTVEYNKDTPRALQDGLEMTFDDNTTIILSYMLWDEAVRYLQILYPDEVRWDAVQYKIDIAKWRLPWLYRLRRWIWRPRYNKPE
jgi:hypothetical protein